MSWASPAITPTKAAPGPKTMMTPSSTTSAAASDHVSRRPKRGVPARLRRDTGSAAREAGDHEMRLRELLGPELYDKFFQLLDPEGRPRTSPPARRPSTLALSAAARAASVVVLTRLTI